MQKRPQLHPDLLYDFGKNVLNKQFIDLTTCKYLVRLIFILIQYLINFFVY